VEESTDASSQCGQAASISATDFYFYFCTKWRTRASDSFSGREGRKRGKEEGSADVEMTRVLQSTTDDTGSNLK
jgi:hypothetical protein